MTEKQMAAALALSFRLLTEANGNEHAPALADQYCREEAAVLAILKRKKGNERRFWNALQAQEKRIWAEVRGTES